MKLGIDKNFYTGMQIIEKMLANNFDITDASKEEFNGMGQYGAGHIRINGVHVNTNEQLETLTPTFFSMMSNNPLIKGFLEIFQKFGVLPSEGNDIPVLKNIPLRKSAHDTPINISNQHIVFAHYLEELFVNQWTYLFPAVYNKFKLEIKDVYLENRAANSSEQITVNSAGDLCEPFYLDQHDINGVTLQLLRPASQSLQDITIAIDKTLQYSSNTNAIVETLKPQLQNMPNIAFNVRGVSNPKILAAQALTIQKRQQQNSQQKINDLNNFLESYKFGNDQINVLNIFTAIADIPLNINNILSRCASMETYINNSCQTIFDCVRYAFKIAQQTNSNAEALIKKLDDFVKDAGQLDKKILEIITALEGGHQYYVILDRKEQKIYGINNTIGGDSYLDVKEFKKQIQVFLQFMDDNTEYEFKFIEGKSRQPEAQRYLAQDCNIAQFCHHAAILSGVHYNDIKDEVSPKFTTLLYVLQYFIEKESQGQKNDLEVIQLKDMLTQLMNDLSRQQLPKLLSSIYYNYGHKGSNNRIHFFTVTASKNCKPEYKNLSGDFLKNRILYDFKTLIEQSKSSDDLANIVKKIQLTPEFAILKKGQGCMTRIRSLTTSSVKAFEQMVAEQEKNFKEENNLN